MTREEFDLYCASLKATTNVIQWGNATVWKIGGQIMAICSPSGAGRTVYLRIFFYSGFNAKLRGI
jgi:predicted DNA-binding protein (MmcQ/YjbR family)